jgi:hypothetical protein
MRKLALPIAVLALALPLASCGGSGGKGGTVASPGPTGKRGATQAGTSGRSGRHSGAGGRANRSAGVRGPGVKASFLDKSFFGMRSAVVYFVAQGKRAGWIDEARSCVRRALRKAPSAFCFAFPSERAFRFSQAATRAPAKMKHQCWAVYYGKPQGRRPLSAVANPAAASQHCPGAEG